MTAVQSRRPDLFPYCRSRHRFQLEAETGGGVSWKNQRIQKLQQQTEKELKVGGANHRWVFTLSH